MSSELAQLRSTLDSADTAYYRPGRRPIMSDREYDALKTRLRELAPDDERLSRVGPPYDQHEIATKTRHQIPMGSLDNLKGGILGLEDWYESVADRLGDDVQPDLAVSLKLDGSSVGLVYEGGRLVRAVTRGDGEVGEDITANAVLFDGVPTVLNSAFTGTVRGEALLHRDDFERLTAGRAADDISNPRNLGNGIIGREDGTQSELINFYAFNLAPTYFPAGYEPPTTEEEKYRRLSELGFSYVATHRVCDTLEEVQEYYEHILSVRAALPFDIDGLVVTLNRVDQQDRFVTRDVKTRLRPKYARALKFPEQTAVTTIVGVVETVGHTGSITPTLALEPVRLGGINCDSAIVTNYDTVNRHELAVGDRVEVVLAGEIIPYFNRVLERGGDRRPVREPATCPCCGSPTTREYRGKAGANLYCTGAATCPEVLFRKIKHWVGTSRKGVGILGLGDAILKALRDAGLVADPADLYRLTPEQFADLRVDSGGRVGMSRAVTIVDNIGSRRRLRLDTFLGALGIDLLGRRRVQVLAHAAGGSLDTLRDWLDDEKLRTIRLPGLGPEDSTLRTAIRLGVDQCRPLIAKLLSLGVEAAPLGERPAPGSTFACLPVGASFEFLAFSPGAPAVWVKDTDTTATLPDGSGRIDVSPVLSVRRLADPAGSPLAGLSFCFTGTREGVAEVEARGGKVDSDVRKGTTYLVQKELKAGKPSSKAQKAEKLGTTVITLDQLRAYLDGSAELPGR